MNDKYFLDTNIFVYCFDELQPAKKVRSLALVAEALQTGAGMISTQVIQEFLNVATRKFRVPLKPDDGKLYLQKVLYPLCHVYPDLDLYRTALDVMADARISFYDSLIVAGAIQGGCALVYSEDLQSGQQIGRVKIVNPYL
jgi:predicted nucleic acid-binding protein